MARRLLVVITSPVADDVLRDLVRSRAGDEAQTLVVAPASDISRLDWLTNAPRTMHARRLPTLLRRPRRRRRRTTSRHASATPTR